jgi:CubicO group peptidase (beta-lactamase class C family)
MYARDSAGASALRKRDRVDSTRLWSSFLEDAAMKAKKIALGVGVRPRPRHARRLVQRSTRTCGALLVALPTNGDVLFWTEPQRDAAFRVLDRLSLLAKSRVVPAGATPTAAAAGTAAQAAARRRRLHGRPAQRRPARRPRRQAAPRALRPRLRRQRRWTSFSVAKSITSTLVGAAIRDGFIRGMDDKVSDYLRR